MKFFLSFCFLKPVLKFSVQAFNNPSLAFSLQQCFLFPFSIFPSTIFFPSAILPFNNTFPSKQSKSFFPLFKGPQSKRPKAKQKVQKPQKPKVNPPEAKAPLPPSRVFYSNKQGGAKGRGVTL
jgi:hypothetical protein